MRAALVARLERRFDGEALALLGTVGTALAAVDRIGVDATPATHVSIADRESGPIGVIVFLEEDRPVEIPLDLTRADRPRSRIADIVTMPPACSIAGNGGVGHHRRFGR
jgi:hypothetical protein